MSTSGSAPKRVLYLEGLRILAVFAVIFIHTASHGSFLFVRREPGSALFWIDLFCSIGCRFAVPVFFAISGATLLHKEESLKKVFLRALRMAAVLVIASMVYFFLKIWPDKPNLNLRNFLTQFLTGTVQIHLWYLYEYIGFLLLLPFLRAMAKNCKPIHFVYLAILSLILQGILPVAEYLYAQGARNFNEYIRSSWILTDTVLYPLMGHFLHRVVTEEEAKRYLPGLWLANLAGIAVSMAMTYYKGSVTGVFSEAESQTFFPCFVLLQCICLFLSLRLWFSAHPPKAWGRDAILSAGSAAFGIYLMHLMFWRWSLTLDLMVILIRCGYSELLASLYVCVYLFLVCWGLTALLKKLPIVKSLL